MWNVGGGHASASYAASFALILGLSKDCERVELLYISSSYETRASSSAHIASLSNAAASDTEWCSCLSMQGVRCEV